MLLDRIQRLGKTPLKLGEGCLGLSRQFDYTYVGFSVLGLGLAFFCDRLDVLSLKVREDLLQLPIGAWGRKGEIG